MWLSKTSRVFLSILGRVSPLRRAFLVLGSGELWASSSRQLLRSGEVVGVRELGAMVDGVGALIHGDGFKGDGFSGSDSNGGGGCAIMIIE